MLFTIRAGYLWVYQVSGLVQRSHQLQPPRPHTKQVGGRPSYQTDNVILLQLLELFPLFGHVPSLQIPACSTVEMQLRQCHYWSSLR